jgi:hypothetical protein
MGGGVSEDQPGGDGRNKGRLAFGRTGLLSKLRRINWMVPGCSSDAGLAGRVRERLTSTTLKLSMPAMRMRPDFGEEHGLYTCSSISNPTLFSVKRMELSILHLVSPLL